jgi:hypothetical protein
MICSKFTFSFEYSKSYFLKFINKSIKFGVILFSIGVLLNEIILAVQGVAAFSYTGIPFVNEMLFGAAIVLVTGIGITAFYSINNKRKKIELHE